MTIRVLLVDDQALVRSGFRMLIESNDGMEIVGEAENGAEALDLMATTPVDVVLMDIRMPVMDGVEATKRIVASGAPAHVLVLTTFDADEYVYAALRAGASGFLLKDSRPEELLQAIRSVANGDAVVAPSATRRLLDHVVPLLPSTQGGRADSRLDVLTDREREVVALVGGVPSFSALAERMHVSDRAKARDLALSRPVTFMVFDLLRLYGVDLTAQPLAQRRSTLEGIGLTGPNAHLPPTYYDGRALHSATLEQGLEGVVSKRLSSRYRPGRRSRDWLKFPHRISRSVVIGGWRLQTDSASRLGAVLVGRPTPSGLTYLGRVGSGLADQDQERVRRALAGRRIDSSPFADEIPSLDAHGTRWVRPEVVIDVQSLGLSAQGRLRQPAYRGLRPDLSPHDIHDEG